MTEDKHFVSVTDKNRKVLDPTNNFALVRKLINNGNAKIINYIPFAIQLNTNVPELETNKMKLYLSEDPGTSNIGISIVDQINHQEIVRYDIEINTNDIKGSVLAKKKNRTARRSELRYRKPRFENRKPAEWNYTHQYLIDVHCNIIEKLKRFFNIEKVVIEKCKFDTSKILNSKVVDYQESPYGVSKVNIKDFVRERANYKCEHPDCKSRSEKLPLHIHHITHRKSGSASESVANKICLCEKCHSNSNHIIKSKIKMWNDNQLTYYDIIGKNEKTIFTEFNLNQMSKTKIGIVINEIIKRITGDVEITYGYITKNKRLRLDIEKGHSNDAFSMIYNGDINNIKRVELVKLNQKKNHNRSRSTFIDAKYLMKNGEIVSGKASADDKHNRFRKVKKGRINKASNEIKEISKNDIIVINQSIKKNKAYDIFDVNKEYVCGGVSASKIYVKDLKGKLITTLTSSGKKNKLFTSSYFTKTGKTVRLHGLVLNTKSDDSD